VREGEGEGGKIGTGEEEQIKKKESKVDEVENTPTWMRQEMDIINQF
jgi:hypothetical protein